MNDQLPSTSGSGQDGRSNGPGNLLLWLLRMQLWFILWGLLAIGLTLAGLLPLMLPALVFAPFVLLVAQEVVAYAMNDLLEHRSAGNAPKAGRLFGRSLIAAVLTALIAFGLGSALFVLLGSAVDDGSPNSFTPHPLQILLFFGLPPAIASAVLVIISGSAVTLLARRLNRDKPVSVMAATLISMLAALTLLLALQYLFVVLEPSGLAMVRLYLTMT